MGWPALIRTYEAAWGEPVQILRVRHASRRTDFHVCTFEPPGRVARVVTMGLSRCVAEDGRLFGVEVLFALGKLELGEIGWERVSNYLIDISVALLRHSNRPVEGSTIAGSTIAPWPPHATVFDLPRGEPEHLEHMELDPLVVRLMWAIPAYPDEIELVKREGIEALDALVHANDYSLADVTRPSLLGA
jgi:hypothetical protein